MSKLSSILIKTKSVDVEFPDLDGFKVKLNYLSRDELVKLRSSCMIVRFNKNAGERQEVLDNDRFLEEYVARSVAGWVGLKAKHLAKLAAVDISALDPNDEIEYSPEEAYLLVKNSTVFDQFITDSMRDMELFSEKKKVTDVKN